MAQKITEAGYPLAPHFLVHVSEAGSVELPYTQAKRILDWLKRVSLGRDIVYGQVLNILQQQEHKPTVEVKADWYY